MKTRRIFLKQFSLALGAIPFIGKIRAETPGPVKKPFPEKVNKPIVLSTWPFGQISNESAWEILSKGGRALDAVEAAAMTCEADLTQTSVGLGGLPDRDGHVTLDACIMDENSNCGSVVFLEHILHPVSVARMVMEKTPHVMLAGEGALQFALENGFTKEKSPTENSKKAWEDWKKKNNYEPKVDRNNHDTIGVIALDEHGNLSGACTTSGMAYKMHGRVGDSPIIGAGLFVDNEVGAATATGNGEEVVRICGTHLVVELMRQGYTPTDACKEATKRIIKKSAHFTPDMIVGFIAINKAGAYGGYASGKGFSYAVRDNAGSFLKDSEFLKKEN